MNFIERESINTPEDAVAFLKGAIQAKARLEQTLEYTKDGEVSLGAIREALKAIKELEERFAGEDHWELEYWLGKGVSWCGEHYSAIEHFEKAYHLSEGVVPDQPPAAGKGGESGGVGRNDIAFEIGESCIKIGHPTFFEKAIEFYRKIAGRCETYHPGLIRLAEAYFETGKFMECVELADETVKRLKSGKAKHDPETVKSLNALISKALSKEALKQRDAGEIADVVRALEMARSRGVLKAIDKNLLDKMKHMRRILLDENHLEEIILGKNVILTIRRELKEKFPGATLDFEAVRKAVQSRLISRDDSPTPQPGDAPGRAAGDSPAGDSPAAE